MQIEDNELNLEIAKMLLEDEKMVVTTAENGKEAVDIEIGRASCRERV